VIKQRNGEPRPQPPPDRNLRNWSAHLIGGKRMQWLGYVKAATAPAAIEAAVFLFGLDDQKRRRLGVNLRRWSILVEVQGETAMYRVILCAAVAILLATAAWVLSPRWRAARPTVELTTANDPIVCAGAEDDESIEACNRVLALNPNNGTHYFARGFHYMHKGDYDAAISDFDQAIALHWNAYDDRGSGLLQQRRLRPGDLRL
jgi:tetratricopeptide (TPR) repeat protein